jgi:hypothetical protein
MSLPLLPDERCTVGTAAAASSNQRVMLMRPLQLERPSAVLPCCPLTLMACYERLDVQRMLMPVLGLLQQLITQLLALLKLLWVKVRVQGVEGEESKKEGVGVGVGW